MDITKLLEIQKLLKPILKKTENPFFKSKYADLPDIIGAIRPILAGAGIYLSQTFSVSNGIVFCSTILTDGKDPIESTVPVATVKDYTAQQYGAIITYGRRYGIQTALCLECDDDDGESVSGHHEKQPQKSDKTIPPKTIMATDAQKSEIVNLAKNRDLPEAQRSFINGIFQVEVTPEKYEKIKATVISAPIIQTDPGIPDNDSVPDF